jgi:hypothetical protein
MSRQNGIDVHAEGQVMTRIISMDSACGWECTHHSKPKLEDLRTSIETAQKRNVKGLHLSGHGSKTCGFVWNAQDSATTGIEHPIHTLVEIVGSAAGQRGHIEFVMLNACSTETCVGSCLRREYCTSCAGRSQCMTRLRGRCASAFGGH